MLTDSDWYSFGVVGTEWNSSPVIVGAAKASAWVKWWWGSGSDSGFVSGPAEVVIVLTALVSLLSSSCVVIGDTESECECKREWSTPLSTTSSKPSAWSAR